MLSLQNHLPLKMTVTYSLMQFVVLSMKDFALGIEVWVGAHMKLGGEEGWDDVFSSTF